MSVRPLSALGATVTKLGATAKATNVEVVRESTSALGKVVNANGIRYRLHGRGGRRVPLTAAWNVRASGTNPAGMVKGVPEGFWHIVEYGRGGGYIVASRQTSSGNRRRGGQASLIQAFGNEQLGQLKPIRTPFGPRQWARPGPHGSIGKPWASSMLAGRPIVTRINATTQARALARSWT